MSDAGDDESNFGVRSIFGATTGRGLVEVELGRERLTLTPAKARESATFLLEAASAAEGDEILMKVLHKAGMSSTRAAHVLMAVRQERAIVERRARAEARKAIAEDQFDDDRVD